MLDVGMLLYFIPPMFGSGLENKKGIKRLMLIISINNNKITLINISKVFGKPNCLTYSFNILIRNYNPPLPLLSFAKINDIYVIDYFKDLEYFIYKDGLKLNIDEFNNIIKRYLLYKDKHKIEMISLNKEMIIESNLSINYNI